MRSVVKIKIEKNNATELELLQTFVLPMIDDIYGQKNNGQDDQN